MKNRLMQLALLILLAERAFASFEVPIEAAFPESDYAKHNIVTAPYVIWNGQPIRFDYHTILASGQKANETDKYAFGQLVDFRGDPIFEVNVTTGLADRQLIANGSIVAGNFSISTNPDFSSLIPVGDRLFSFVHFEAPGPQQAYFVELKQDKSTCNLQAISAQPTNWSAYGGLWTPCAGSVTPWMTHLGSEEYEPDAAIYAAARNLSDFKLISADAAVTTSNYMRYWSKYPNDTTWADVLNYFKPYRYGFATEMTPYANGTYSVTKHYSLGRMAYELPYVMPDNRTVYMTDDGENTAFWMYKASTPGSLTCGNLFGAKFTQLSAERGGNFTLSWIDLGFACDADIAPHTANTTFNDIFESAKFVNTSAAPCPAGFNSVNTGSMLGAQCLKLRPGMDRIASRLESRRYLALRGGTTEFTKWEGFTFSPNQGEFGKIYTSVSRIENSMEDNMVGGRNDTRWDEGGPNTIRLPNNRCGCVYQMDVNSAYNATAMYPLVCGNTRTNTDEFNRCDKNSVSAPDNVSFLRGHNQLIIGEDTSDHQNDVIWLYNFDDNSLKRMQTTPYGAETTSPYFHENIGGCSYLVSVVQHPYGESDYGRASDPASSGKSGKFGYLGPLRALATPAPIRSPLVQNAG